VPVRSHSEGLTRALSLQALTGKDCDAFATVGRNALNRHPSEKQAAAMLAAGHRMITYYRRGFGASSRPSVGYEFVTLATDLHVLLSRLRLRGWYW